jgi:hypothetical protein
MNLYLLEYLRTVSYVIIFIKRLKRLYDSIPYIQIELVIAIACKL